MNGTLNQAILWRALSITLCVSALLALTPRASAQLTVANVTAVLAQSISRAALVSPNAVIAVVDREGYVLGVWSVNGTTPATVDFTNQVAHAIAKAGTAAFLSSHEHAFTSRTAGFIVQQNFPPGVQNKPPGPLVGVNFSNLSFSDINRYKDAATFVPPPAAANGTNGAAVPTPISGGLAGTAGGVPLYKAGLLVGGVGVSAPGDDPLNITPSTVVDASVFEDVALAGQVGFEPAARIFGSHVFIDGIRIPYVTSTTLVGAVTPLGGIGANFIAFPPRASPPVAYPVFTLGGVTGELRMPIIADPSAVALPGGTARLTAAEVTSILAAGANRARTTRAGIRLPRGRPVQVFICVVNNPSAAGSPPIVLGSFCTSPDAARFSWDVSVQKARTTIFFSSDARAFSSRAVGFLAQANYPPGIVGTAPGIFLGLQEKFSIITAAPVSVTNPLNGGTITTATTVNPNLPNGITIFPGGFPLYRDGVLIGAIGVSGDGIDQDDLVAASGAALFPPPEGVRSDRSQYRGARLPFAKFPRNPAL